MEIGFSIASTSSGKIGASRASSTSSGTGVMAGPRQLGADVDDVGAVCDQFLRLRQSRVARLKLAAVGEGIRRDVQNTHDDGTHAEEADELAASRLCIRRRQAPNRLKRLLRVLPG